MNSVFRVLKHSKKSFFVCFATNSCIKQLSKPVFRQPQKIDRIDPLGWFLLVIPAATFSLGVWQLQRKTWKENLIAELKERSNSNPISLPENPEEINKLEYRPVRVTGTFLHDKEIFLGPRSLLFKGDASTQSSLLSSNKARTSQGYLVVTPFKLRDREETILINRGWVSSRNVDPKTREKGQINGVVEVIGVLRLNENRPNFSIKNKEGSNLFLYRDLKSMCAVTGASPIFLDLTDEFDGQEGPVGGQTRITLRNEHFSYVLTWFSLSGATSYMWYKKFLARR